MASSAPATPDTLVTLKVNFQGSTRRFKLPLRDLGVSVFEDKIRALLCISSEANATFERYSDSASSYVVLDPANQSIWKQLFRAAKAKQKLKLRVTLQDSDDEPGKGPKPVTVEDEPEQENQDFAQTKPEAPLISTAPSEVTESVTETPEPSSQDFILRELRQDEENKKQQLLDKAMSRLSLSIQQETARQQSTPPSETTTSVCVAPKAANFAVCCNNCDRTIPDSHYHCSTCDDGDFDLCPECVEMGVTCYNPEHWLLKRFVRGDHILVSTTERVAPKPKVEVAAKEAEAKAVVVPSPPISAPSTPVPSYRTLVRTCNSCVQEMPDKEFLHCTTCEDFDLCKTCFGNDQHGHHPQHGFTPAVEGTPMPLEISRRLAPGRDQRHHAICDGCDKFIFGVRHKCLDCPDWDYCAACIVNAGFVHPNHRFVPIYEQIADYRSLTAAPRPCHYGICCDGPLCSGKRKTYIVGERYKCTVCHDTDFCANCEASPANTHNRTHPLIKFKTPVRRVEVTTKGEDEHGQMLPVMGDRLGRKVPSLHRSRETSSSINSATTSLHTVVDVKPEPEPEPEVEKDTTATKAQPALAPSIDTYAMQKRLQAQQQQVRLAKERFHMIAQARRTQALAQARAQAQATPARGTPEPTVEKLIAVFERDTVADGTVMPPNQVFQQTWVLRNAGDIAWPAGCSVKFVGGDYMGHIDSSHPAGIRDLVSASESTVSYDAVAPGQEFAFTVLLRTPTREGKVISWWRLTTKEGDKFGHRLWCDVTVQAPKALDEAPKEVKEDIPAEGKEESTAVEATPETAEASQMIFPKLEKESPASSVHEDVKPEAAEVVDEEADDFEDCGEDEDWAEESDDGFQTDEEYDILDASDEEFGDEQQKKTQRK